MIKDQSRRLLEEPLFPETKSEDITSDVIQQMAEENAQDSFEVVTNMVNYVNASRDPYWAAANRLRPKQASLGGLSMI